MKFRNYIVHSLTGHGEQGSIASSLELEVYVESRWLITVNAGRSCDNSVFLYTPTSQTQCQLPLMAANMQKRYLSMQLHEISWYEKVVPLQRTKVYGVCSLHTCTSGAVCMGRVTAG